MAHASITETGWLSIRFVLMKMSAFANSRRFPSMSRKPANRTASGHTQLRSETFNRWPEPHVLPRHDKRRIRGPLSQAGENPHRHLRVVDRMEGAHPKQPRPHRRTAPEGIGLEVDDVRDHLGVEAVSLERPSEVGDGTTSACARSRTRRVQRGKRAMNSGIAPPWRLIRIGRPGACRDPARDVLDHEAAPAVNHDRQDVDTTPNAPNRGSDVEQPEVAVGQVGCGHGRIARRAKHLDVLIADRRDIARIPSQERPNDADPRAAFRQRTSSLEALPHRPEFSSRQALRYRSFVQPPEFMPSSMSFRRVRAP